MTHNTKNEGKNSAKDMASGKIDKKELHERYADAKFRGEGKEFKEGYAEGASE